MDIVEADNVMAAWQSLLPVVQQTAKDVNSDLGNTTGTADDIRHAAIRFYCRCSQR